MWYNPGKFIDGGRPDVLVFAKPLLLTGLIGIPVLIGIYLLRSQYRQQKVSSLFLWKDQIDAVEGGWRFEPFRQSLLFLLEAAIILLLCLAAADPLFSQAFSARNLVVILDDSFSMQAGREGTVREKAVRFLQHEITRRPVGEVSCILARETPMALGSARTSAELGEVLTQWNCLTPKAYLEPAIVLARDAGGAFADILVLTDTEPPERYRQSNLRWVSLGSSTGNLAIVSAHWSKGEKHDRIFLEVANCSAEPRTTRLTIVASGTSGSVEPGGTAAPAGNGAHAGTTLFTQELTLGSRETRRVFLNAAASLSPVFARIGPDELAIDNQVVLLNQVSQPVRVGLKVASPQFGTLLTRTIVATGRGVIASGPVDLLITDEVKGTLDDPRAWRLEIDTKEPGKSYIGPFVLESGHPLTEGLSFEGVVWGAGSHKGFPGRHLIAAGSRPLLSEFDLFEGKVLSLRLLPEYSTLIQSSDWPILFANLMNWRDRFLPGLKTLNVALGTTARLRVPDKISRLEILPAQGPKLTLPVSQPEVAFQPEFVGLAELVAGPLHERMAVNPLSLEESDLTKAATGEWGAWDTAAPGATQIRSYRWFPAFLALLCLLVHQAVLHAYTFRKTT